MRQNVLSIEKNVVHWTRASKRDRGHVPPEFGLARTPITLFPPKRNDDLEFAFLQRSTAVSIVSCRKSGHTANEHSKGFLIFLFLQFPSDQFVPILSVVHIQWTHKVTVEPARGWSGRRRLDASGCHWRCSAGWPWACELHHPCRTHSAPDRQTTRRRGSRDQ